MDEKMLGGMQKFFDLDTFPKVAMLEKLVKLARLGLWAENRGIPALLHCEKAFVVRVSVGDTHYEHELYEPRRPAIEALAALPKERGEG